MFDVVTVSLYTRVRYLVLIVLWAYVYTLYGILCILLREDTTALASRSATQRLRLPWRAEQRLPWHGQQGLLRLRPQGRRPRALLRGPHRRAPPRPQPREQRRAARYAGDKN